MKKTFTKEYILSNRGCYSREEVEKLAFISQKTITLTTLLNGLPIKDFNWFFIRKCELTIEQKQEIALIYAESVLNIFEKKHNNDKKVRNCIQGIKDFRSGKITKQELFDLRAAANAAYAAAYAADDADADAAAAAAADAAAAAAAYAAYAADADAADAAAYAAYVAAYAAYAAAYAADDAAKMKKIIKEFIKNN